MSHANHIMVSDLDKQIIRGKLSVFELDPMTILIGNRIAERLMLQVGDRVNIQGGTGNLQLRVAGLFETGVSQIDKNRVYVHLSTAKAFLGKRFSGSILQLSMFDPPKAPEIAAQIQETIGHRTMSWQEREQVWLDVFKALRVSSAITVSSILLLSGLGIFNVFAIMVIEKTRDIAILRSIGFQALRCFIYFFMARWNRSFFGIILRSCDWHFIHLRNIPNPPESEESFLPIVLW